MSERSGMNKYRNTKSILDGITFDSKREAERYAELKLLQKSGQISDLELQPKFELQEHFKHQGKTVRAITYIADFKYLDHVTGTVVVEDVKGAVTKEFAIKKKLFLKKYGDQYDFRIVK